uniref:Subunit 5 of NADH-plastoquinone oxidoreductase n=1 Tax=Prasinococcus sp. CCMP1194 TaxID=110672 RepID=A0A088CJW1_9VIRI|nr:subunit 5 of NADH-plastoquinone oxidoreductase [Prasinococcus sp. CCMP1194]
MIYSLYFVSWLIPFIPFVNFLLGITGLLFFQKATQNLRKLYSTTSLVGMGSSFFLSSIFLLSQYNQDPPYTLTLEWLKTSNILLEMGLFIDPLTACMLVLVTSVGFCVMLYTINYMFYDYGFVRFFSYLNLFIASMIGLVMSPNLLQLYFFWELIGICSFLLVGFWFTRPTAADACQKAFIVNRIGDCGFFLGILGFYYLTGSTSFITLRNFLYTITEYGDQETYFWLGVLCFCFFLSIMTKSAQIPFHIWLPDAMEGPTPISALIHAATLVTAGVFLFGRLFSVFNQFPEFMSFVAIIGTGTALIGATSAVRQTDLKKVLAYSTISQLGYIVMGLGSGLYTASLFHLFTHAYSKALLFLTAGSVIQNAEPVLGFNPAKNQNIYLMGNLKKYMPLTSFFFLIGTCSLSGIPPFAGFWSKDDLLFGVLENHTNLWFVAWLTAGITSFYMFKIYFVTFEKTKFSFKLQSPISKEEATTPAMMNLNFDTLSVQPSESKRNTIIALGLLCIPTIFLGFAQTPFSNYFNTFLFPNHLVKAENFLELLPFIVISIFISVLGASASILYYSSSKIIFQDFIQNTFVEVFTVIKTIFQNKWFFDFIGMKIIAVYKGIGKFIAKFDQFIFDGVINFTSLGTISTGEALKYTTTGSLQLSLVLFVIAYILFFYFIF